MSDLVQRLRKEADYQYNCDACSAGRMLDEAADALESQSGEIERLRSEREVQEAAIACLRADLRECENTRDAEIEGLRKAQAGEIESLRKDAERLDYIEGNARCDPKMDGQHVWWPTSFNHRLVGSTLRAAIDAAKEKT